MSSSDKPPESSEPLVLGVELAAAAAIEQVRLESSPASSPLIGVRYHPPEAHVESLSFNETASDRLLRAMAEEWAQLGTDELADLRSVLSMDDFYTLMTFARRSLVLALRNGEASWPQSALHALTAIAYERVDYRDLSLAAGMVAHALGALGQDVQSVFSSAAERSAPGSADVLNRFAEQPAWTLAQCGFEQVGTGSQATLVGRNFKPYSPTMNLGSIAREIGTAIETDNYVVDSVSIADKLPSVWLQGSSWEAAGLASLEHATGCATVRASRPNEAYFSHMFVVFIVELLTPEDAVAVATSARECSASHARMALSEGSVCAVLISRSVVQGEPGNEDDRSLRRFEAGFADALRSAVP